MHYKFQCPLPPTLNDQIAEARNNKYKSAATKKKWTQLVADVVKDAPRFDGMVWVEFEWHVKNFSRDADNILAAAKFIMDGLVLAKVITNDSLRVIAPIQLHQFAKGTSDTVTITLSDRPLFEIVRLG